MARMLYIYDGQNLLATLKVADDGAVRAFNPAGKYLGEFPSPKAASAAITAADLDEDKLAKRRQQLAVKHRRRRDKIKKSAA